MSADVGTRAPGRIAIGVSGAGTNLRALAAAAGRGALGGDIALVFADRDCPALAWATEAGLDTALVPGGSDEALLDALGGAGVDLVVLAGYMRLIGPAVLAAFEERILNVHPSLLPAFPGAHAVRDALAAEVHLSGCTIHIVTDELDAGPIVAQEAVPVFADDDEPALRARIQAVEHRVVPMTVAARLADITGAAPPVPRRALLSVSDKTGLVDLARGLVDRGFELVSTGGTASTIRAAGLPVTDVAAVTGFPEMLDGRVKTLHPRIHAGILADRRRQEHRDQLADAGIAPFELIVVNLYPFAEALERPGIDLDGVVEEIDIGGPSMVRAAAKNHANVAIITDPARYREILDALDQGPIPLGLRSELAIEAFRHTAAYDARIAAELPRFMASSGVALPAEPGLPGSDDPFPRSLTIGLEKVETLRYGENPHQPAARYRRPGATVDDGLFATDRLPLQGKALSYNNVLDAAAADAIGRSLRGAGAVIVKHTNPCGAAERPALLDAWSAALEADPVSAFGGVVALTQEVDERVAEALVSIFLEIVVAPAYTAEARAVLATKPNLRVLIDEVLASEPSLDAPAAADPIGAIRSAGGAILVGAPDTAPDDPNLWTCVTRRVPTDRELLDLDLAWRLVRGVTSNAIVLVRDSRLIGLGSGQTSRVDAARQAIDKVRAFLGDEALQGSVCASDAFFPFPDAVEVCLAAGVSAYVQPGGSINDATITAVADGAAATMLVTGVRHFRH